jgi:hypothetical protein
MSDIRNWYEANYEQLYSNAKKWAKKYTLEQLRDFQSSYLEKEKSTEDEYKYHVYDNMWACATYAIGIKEFGE